MDQIFADACNDGISFILQSPDLVPEKGGLIRDPGQGHLVTITGRGGTGKSLLALQFLTDLLEQSKGVPAAFYFTLEASPWELARQLQAFKFGHRYSRCNEPPGNRQSSDGRKEPSFTNMNPESLYGKCAGLHIKAIPSPTEDLSVLIRQVRQTIADELAKQALVSESNQGFEVVRRCALTSAASNSWPIRIRRICFFLLRTTYMNSIDRASITLKRFCNCAKIRPPCPPA